MLELSSRVDVLKTHTGSQHSMIGRTSADLVLLKTQAQTRSDLYEPCKDEVKVTAPSVVSNRGHNKRKVGATS